MPSRLPPWLQRQRDVVDIANRAPSLRSTSKRLFSFIVENAGEKGFCYHSNRTIATKQGVSVRWVRLVLAELDRAGLISCRHLKWRSDIPDGTGEVVENPEGIRLIVVIFLWEKGPMPGVPYDRSAPLTRRRPGAPTSNCSSGEDQRTPRRCASDPTGEEQSFLRKGKPELIEEVTIQNSLPKGDHTDRAPLESATLTDDDDRARFYELYEERAVIMEYEGGLRRSEAEHRAWEVVGDGSQKPPRHGEVR
jgi:hypothetical protein